MLDQLLDGGFFIPEKLGSSPNEGCAVASRPLLVLLKGPPGSGKSTLTLEICYRAELVKGEDDEERWAGGRLSSIYASLESPTDWIIDNARKGYGWDSAGRVFERFHEPEQNLLDKTVVVLGNDSFWTAGPGLANPGPQMEKLKASSIVARIRKESAARNPGIVAIDGINVLPADQQDELFQSVCRSFLGSEDSVSSAFVVIVAIDSPLPPEEQSRWEFIADLVITMSTGYEMDYYLRAIEISKARYQSHALGKQRMKIRGVHEAPLAGPLMEAVDVSPLPPTSRVEGGIAVFPSVHRALSRFKSTRDRGQSDCPVGYMPTPHSALNEIIAPNAHQGNARTGGLPRGKCTAFLGGRGTLKSHIAYHIAIARALEEADNKVTIITLRDEIDALLETLGEIARMEEIGAQWEEHRLSEEHLRCVYFWPGYISPEQFYQTVSREILEQKPDLLVLAGLDRIEDRFPLCNHEPIFVPALISLLNLSGVTSLVTSASAEADHPRGEGSIGPALLPMADLVLRFEAHQSPEHDQSVRIQAIRVPRGEIGRSTAMAHRSPTGNVEIVVP